MNPIYRAMLQKSCIAFTLLGILTPLSILTPAAHAQSTTFNTYTSSTAIRSASNLLKQGQEKFQRQDYRGAISDFNQAMLLNPNDANVYFNRGLLLFQLGDEFGAIEDFDATLLRNPRHALAYFHRAGVRYGLGEQPGAIQDLQLAAQLFLLQGDKTRYQKAQKLIKQLQY